MKDKLYPILTKCGLFFERVSRQTEARGLFGLRSLMKLHLTINAQLRNTRLRCLERWLHRSQAYSSGGQFYCNAGLQRKKGRDLAAAHIPSVQERVLMLLRQVCFYQCQLDQRANVTAHFGWC
jgi:hypothetical protein